MEKLREYALPTAWRGIASPRYLRLARWLSLVEELGGVRPPIGGPFDGQALLGEPLTGPGLRAGKMDMELAALTSGKHQVDELRQFVTEELSRHERLILMLSYAEGLSLAEIAQVLDLPEPTVARLFRKTLQTLEERFG